MFSLCKYEPTLLLKNVLMYSNKKEKRKGRVQVILSDIFFYKYEPTLLQNIFRILKKCFNVQKELKRKKKGRGPQIRDKEKTQFLKTVLNLEQKWSMLSWC